MDAGRPRGAGGSKYGALHRTEGPERPAGRGNALIHAEEPLEKKPYPPGEHGRGRHRQTEFGLRLMEKQKARWYYGVSEKQFRRAYDRATRMQGVSGENLLRLMELRMDNVVYRMGFSTSRPQARQ